MDETKLAQSLPTKLPARSPVSSIDRQQRSMEIVICTSELDRQGDIINPAGLDFSNFMNNPVVLWAHDINRPPVGRVLEINNENNEVTATVEFASTAFASEVFELYAGGYLNAWSIGFIPRRWRRLSKNDGGGYEVFEAEVVEVSAVPVPANAQALTKALETVSDVTLMESLQEQPQVSDFIDDDQLINEESLEEESLDEIAGGVDDFEVAGENYEQLFTALTEKLLVLIDQVCEKLSGAIVK